MTAPENENRLDALPTEKSPLARIADRHGIPTSRLLAVLRETVLPKPKRPEDAINDAELLAFLMTADRYGLDPVMKQIYAFQGKGGGIVPIVGVDGWANIINSQSMCDGFTFIENRKDDGTLVSITCRMKVKGREIATEVTEYLQECKRNTEPWKEMPTRMLRHRALIQCARVVFGISGIYDEDEGRDIASGSIANGLSERDQQADKLRRTIEDAKEAKAKREAQPTEPAEVWSKVDAVDLSEGTATVDGKAYTYLAALHPQMDMAHQGVATEVLVVDGTITKARDA